MVNEERGKKSKDVNKSKEESERDTKDRKKTEKERSKKEKKQCKSSCCKIILATVVVLAAIGSYKVYDELTSVPGLPEVDLNAWWGVNRSAEEDTSVRPFRIVFGEAMLEDLRKRFEVYRAVVFRKKSITESWEYGIHSDAFASVFAHWQFNYTFRHQAKFLNKFDHYKTKIQGLDLHFVHVKPKVDKNVKVLPIMLLHGWPGSIREFYDVIPLLTNPRPGYDFVFEVIAPSLPGFVYSEGPKRPGLSLFQIAIILRNLMQKLGFKQYYIQGGDLGHTIGTHMSTIFSEEVLGFHTNFPVNFSKLALLTWLFGNFWPSLVTKGVDYDRMYPVQPLLDMYLEESGYLHLQATKPDTLGIALTDSPIALSSYILDKFVVFFNYANKFDIEGGLSTVDKTALLDNIMLYWTSNCITTSMRVFKESFQSSEEVTMLKVPSPVPTWALRFKNDLVHQPDFMLRWKYPNLIGSTNIDHGGHYGAFENPKEFADDVFLAVKIFLSIKI